MLPLWTYRAHPLLRLPEGHDVVPHHVCRRVCRAGVWGVEAECGWAVIQGRIAAQMGLLSVSRHGTPHVPISLLHRSLQKSQAHVTSLSWMIQPVCPWKSRGGQLSGCRVACAGSQHHKRTCQDMLHTEPVSA